MTEFIKLKASRAAAAARQEAERATGMRADARAFVPGAPGWHRVAETGEAGEGDMMHADDSMGREANPVGA